MDSSKLNNEQRLATHYFSVPIEYSLTCLHCSVNINVEDNLLQWNLDETPRHKS